MKWMKQMRKFTAGILVVMLATSNLTVPVKANDAVTTEQTTEQAAETIVPVETVNPEVAAIEDDILPTIETNLEESIPSEVEPITEVTYEEESEEVTETTEEVTETTEEITETTEEVTEPVIKTDFCYEDSYVKITAIAKPEANLPETAVLKADYLPEGSPVYKQTVKTVTSQVGTDDKEFLEFVCYDVYFEANSQKIEPAAGTVNVTMTYKQPQFQDVADEATEYATYHILDDSNKVENVTGTINTNSNGEVTSVGFNTESFSVFTTVALKAYKGSDEGTDPQYKQSSYQYNNFGLGTTNNGVHDNYNNFGTTFFEVILDGKSQVGYCIESLFGTTNSNNSVDQNAIKELLQNQESSLQKVLYYGYEGPGDSSKSFFTVEMLDKLYQNQDAYVNKIKDLRQDAEANDKNHNGLYMTEEQYHQLKAILQMDDSDPVKQRFYYVMTHMAASMAYFEANPDTHGMVSYIEAGAWGTNAVGMSFAESWYNYLRTNERPNIKFEVNEGSNEVKLIGQPQTVRMTVTVPDGLLYTFDGKSYSAGSTFTMKPGESFTYKKIKTLGNNASSSLSYSFTGKATDISGNILFGSWETIIIDGGNSQDIGALSYKDTIELSASYTIDWKEDYFKLTKCDEFGNIIKVAGTEFDVFADADCKARIGTVVTDSTGTASGYVSYSGTDSMIYLKETKAPYGYILDPTVISVDLSKDSSKSLTHVNKTLYSSIYIQKVDKEDHKKSLDGAKLVFLGQDENGNFTVTIDTWTSNAEAVHNICSKLEAGKQYILRELIAPDGYEKADDILFTLDMDGTIVTEAPSMIDELGRTIYLMEDDPIDVVVQDEDVKKEEKKTSGVKTGDHAEVTL